MKTDYNKLIGTFISFILAFIGTITLVIIKKIDDKLLSNQWIFIPIIISIISIFITFIGLKYTSLTILNMQWNVISNIIVTIVGILYFNKDKLFNSEGYDIVEIDKHYSTWKPK
jgi:amino acid transporter